MSYLATSLMRISSSKVRIWQLSLLAQMATESKNISVHLEQLGSFYFFLDFLTIACIKNLKMPLESWWKFAPVQLFPFYCMWTKFWVNFFQLQLFLDPTHFILNWGENWNLCALECYSELLLHKHERIRK